MNAAVNNVFSPDLNELTDWTDLRKYFPELGSLVAKCCFSLFGYGKPVPDDPRGVDASQRINTFKHILVQHYLDIYKQALQLYFLHPLTRRDPVRTSTA